MKTDVANLRQEYTQAKLDLESTNPSPFLQFEKWFQEALSSELLEPNAMVLSTSNLEHQITQRTVLLKAYDENGFVFYTNYKSKKATQIEENPHVSMLFPWYGLERQVSITGIAKKVSSQESLKYFLSRPKGSQLGAWVSHQSRVISSRSILESKLEEIKSKFKSGEIPLPDFWGGYRIIPKTIEFWQGRANRLHDRLLYTSHEGTWNIERLSP
ncbi:MAG: pyridoxamine 5'-phosphate oxidase [Cyclobacteriaceae bacterium]